MSEGARGPGAQDSGLLRRVVTPGCYAGLLRGRDDNAVQRNSDRRCFTGFRRIRRCERLLRLAFDPYGFSSRLFYNAYKANHPNSQNGELG